MTDPPDQASATTVRAQSVLYLNSLSDVWRFLRGLGAAAKVARSAGLVASINLCLGDCSPSPVLGEADIEQIRQFSGELGFDSVDATFFGSNLGHAGGHNRLAMDATT